MKIVSSIPKPSSAVANHIPIHRATANTRLIGHDQRKNSPADKVRLQPAPRPTRPPPRPTKIWKVLKNPADREFWKPENVATMHVLTSLH